MDSRALFTALVAAVSVLRLLELGVSRRNLARLRAAGGVEHGANHYPAMVGVHVGLLLSCLAEVWLLARPWVPARASIAWQGDWDAALALAKAEKRPVMLAG